MDGVRDTGVGGQVTYGDDWGDGGGNHRSDVEATVDAVVAVVMVAVAADTMCMCTIGNGHHCVHGYVRFYR